MRRRVLASFAIPLAAGLARMVAQELAKRGHAQAANHAQHLADSVHPARRKGRR